MDDETQAAVQSERGAGDDATGVVMDLLAEHVPLTLLADLAVAEPRSAAILAAEGLPEDAWWEGEDDEGEVPGPGPRAEDDVPVDPDAAADVHPA
ncbi:hypothetical protein [Cellulomonas pakistanensis]|uniref:Uncharacterized protein n=1 Tax=Cellulomonas pakistanensis TaxID=992287 RepID=A0A919P7G3_9CELL|nr:hypothetical protein [Cellulomonas pakistanensis]GIG35730.1 hypothetical protein Cpa01nite_11110 [Cellulomonas pakistanensis]